MKFKNLSIDFVVNDELLDLIWISNFDSEQTCVDRSKKTFEPVEFSLEADEINALVSNLPSNQNKSTDKKQAFKIKEFALISNPFYLFDSEDTLLELDFSLI